ncbi:MAG: hypothetical protein WD066_08925 [Planctomycetaceae bacterium]
MAATAALLIAALVAAWVLPYYRERAAITTMRRYPTALLLSGGNVDELSFGIWLDVEERGPGWVRSATGGDWGIFDRVSEVHVHRPAKYRLDLFDHLNSLRSLDRLSVRAGMLTESELDQLRRRFPRMTVDVHDRKSQVAVRPH